MQSNFFLIRPHKKCLTQCVVDVYRARIARYDRTSNLVAASSTRSVDVGHHRRYISICLSDTSFEWERIARTIYVINNAFRNVMPTDDGMCAKTSRDSIRWNINVLVQQRARIAESFIESLLGPFVARTSNKNAPLSEVKDPALTINLHYLQRMSRRIENKDFSNFKLQLNYIKVYHAYK